MIINKEKITHKHTQTQLVFTYLVPAGGRADGFNSPYVQSPLRSLELSHRLQPLLTAKLAFGASQEQTNYEMYESTREYIQ